MGESDRKTIDVVREGLEKACKEFTLSIAGAGFSRTKKMFWTREHPHTVDFIHFHRGGSSYGSPINFSVDIRVHFGIRVLNAEFTAASLNGPWSDPTLMRTGRYHLRFNAKSGSTYERCVDDLLRFVLEQGEPWFQRFRNPRSLIDQRDTPLRSDDVALLEAALRGEVNLGNVANSKKLLGIKIPKN